jgi:hypothetical protein
MVDPRVLLKRGKNTESNSYRYTENYGIQIYNHGCGKLGCEKLRNVLSIVLCAVTNTPIPFREYVAKEDSELNEIGLIISKCLTARLDNSGMRVTYRQRSQGEHPNKNEAH